MDEVPNQDASQLERTRSTRPLDVRRGVLHVAVE